MNKHLLPVGSSDLEAAAAIACGDISDIDVPIIDLWDPVHCPVRLLPYLAWALSVDYWDENWPESVKRSIIAASYEVHRQKGTIYAIKQALAPLGYETTITEWFDSGDPNGTFRISLDTKSNGVSEETYHEVERLIHNAKSRGRHLIGLQINMRAQASINTCLAQYSGDVMTIYPYIPK